MLKWRVYFGDGSTFDNLKGDPSQCRNVNVQAIVIRDDINGNVIWHGVDWYLYLNGGWIGLKDTVSLIDYVLNDFKNIRVIKQGRTINDEYWKTIFDRAMNDSDFPSTSRAKKPARG